MNSESTKDENQGEIISSKSVEKFTNTSKYYLNNLNIISTSKSKLIFFINFINRRKYFT
jgi:hypothetical protein